MLYKQIKLDEEYYKKPEDLQYVGVYVLKWGKLEEPTEGFREATIEEVEEYLNILKNRL